MDLQIHPDHKVLNSGFYCLEIIKRIEHKCFIQAPKYQLQENRTNDFQAEFKALDLRTGQDFAYKITISLFVCILL